MKRYSVRCRENGSPIDFFDSLDEAFSTIENYVRVDLEEFNKDTLDFYEIYDNEKCCCLSCWKTIDGKIKFMEL